MGVISNDETGAEQHEGRVSGGNDQMGALKFLLHWIFINELRIGAERFEIAGYGRQSGGLNC